MSSITSNLIEEEVVCQWLDEINRDEHFWLYNLRDMSRMLAGEIKLPHRQHDVIFTSFMSITTEDASNIKIGEIPNEIIGQPNFLPHRPVIDVKDSTRCPACKSAVNLQEKYERELNANKD